MFLLKQAFWAAILVSWGCLSGLLYADDKKSFSSVSPLIPKQLLFGNPEKASPRLSGDGTHLAYLAPDEKGVLNVWVKELKSSSEPKKMTNDQDQGIHYFFWQFDSEHILYVQDKNGDENWHLYQTQIKTQETKDLTPFEGVRAGILDYNPHFPDQMLILMNQRDPTVNDVYRYHFSTQQMTLDTQNPGQAFGWVTDNLLQVRMAQSYKEDGSTLIQMRESKDSPWKEWLTVSPLESVSVEGFTADNQSVYLLTDQGTATQTAQLLLVKLKTNQSQVIAKDPLYDLEGIITNPLTHTLEAIEVEREKIEWIIVDESLKNDFAFISNQLSGPFLLVSRDLKNTKWIIAALSDQKPTHYYLYEREKDKPTLEFLFSTQPKLEGYALSPMEPISFHARDGMKLYGYLTLPKGESHKNLPTVLLVHGGPWVRDSWGLNQRVQWLVNRGYAVLQINYRGSTGYGKDYVNAGNREWAGKMHTDLIDGKNWMVKKGYSDPKKVAIYGGSYGGYAALVGLTFTPEEFCCGISVVGPSNLVTLLESSPPYWKPLIAVNNIRMGNLETEPDFLKARSPLFKAGQIVKPLLIAHGTNDPRVKQAESDQIVKVMREKNIPVDYLVFADEGHGFARPENRLKFYAAAEAFLAKYLGGRQEAATKEMEWESLKK